MTEKVTMIAEARFKHEGKQLRTGDEFRTELGNAEDLRALGFAKYKVTEKIEELDTENYTRRGTYRRRDVKVES